LSAARFERIFTKLGGQAAHWLVNFLQFALPIALAVYVGLFTRMANLAEAALVLFVCIAFLCFSLFTACVLELTEYS